jgi:UDP-2,4-diacetamido-2,4,6-trideoxy-beta-L-altropyranose hydrolase
MKVVFRTTGGPLVGFGHVRRCLSLAHELRAAGADPVFLLDGDPSIVELVEACAFSTRYQPPHDDLEALGSLGARVLIADSYALSSEYFVAMQQAGAYVVAIDDLADCRLAADMVVNAGVCAEWLPYPRKHKTAYLLGPRFALLRPEFAMDPGPRDVGPVQRVLVTVGGSDPHGLAIRLATWAVDVLDCAQVDLVIGPFGATPGDESRPAAIAIQRQPGNIRRLMLDADLALSGGGQTLYELAATGTPVVTVQIADNQASNIAGFAGAGTLVDAGAVDEADFEARVKAALFGLAENHSQRATMSRKGRAIVDGLGARRVAEAVLDSVGGDRAHMLETGDTHDEAENRQSMGR